MRFFTRVLTGTAVVLASLSVSAQQATDSSQSQSKSTPEIPWTFGDAQYSFITDNGDAHGLGIGGSLGFANIGHAQLRFNDYGISADDDRDGFDISGGVHFALADLNDAVVYGDLGLYDYDDREAFYLRGGIRHMLLPKLEGNAFLQLSNGEKGNNNKSDYHDVVLNVGGQYALTDMVQLGLNYSTGSSVTGDALIFNVRLAFGDLL
jgi:hypothetical protein